MKNNTPIYGIQGGKGSFNEQALQTYTKNHDIKDFKTEYLFTTERVFQALEAGRIDFGQFALHNSLGGLVQESLEGMSKYTFDIVEEFSIIIEHCMMKPKNVDMSKIDTLMSHPQVFKQCKNTLDRGFSEYKRISGAGDLIDHARVAEDMSKGEIKENIAVLGPEILASIYDLDIVYKGLQDLDNNYTTFLMVKKVS